MRPVLRRAPLALAVCLALAGCALTPAPERSTYGAASFNGQGLPAGWTSAPTTAYVDWIGLKPEPELTALVSESLQQSQSLQGMAAQVQAAGEMVTVSGGGQLPQLGLTGSTQQNLKDGTTVLTAGMFGISWEIDVWGRIRYGVAAAEEAYASAQDDYEFARLSLAANVAKAWYATVEADAQLELLRASRTATAQLLALTDTRVAVGAANPYGRRCLRGSRGRTRSAPRL